MNINLKVKGSWILQLVTTHTKELKFPHCVSIYFQSTILITSPALLLIHFIQHDAKIWKFWLCYPGNHELNSMVTNLVCPGTIIFPLSIHIKIRQCHLLRLQGNNHLKAIVLVKRHRENINILVITKMEDEFGTLLIFLKTGKTSFWASWHVSPHRFSLLIKTWSTVHWSFISFNSPFLLLLSTSPN